MILPKPVLDSLIAVEAALVDINKAQTTRLQDSPSPAMAEPRAPTRKQEGHSIGGLLPPLEPEETHRLDLPSLEQPHAAGRRLQETTE